MQLIVSVTLGLQRGWRRVIAFSHAALVELLLSGGQLQGIAQSGHLPFPLGHLSRNSS